MLLTAQLTRGSVHINQGDLPTWKITLEVANRTDSPVQVGESLVVIEKARGGDDYVAVFVARERKPPADHLKRLADRYGLTWGVTVPTDEPGVWPFGALTDGSRDYAMGLLFAILSAPRPKAYHGGGYPSLDSHQETSIQEELIYPASLKAGREAVFVVAPVMRPSGQPAVAHVFRFDTGDTLQAGQSFSPAETWTLTLVREQIEKVATDTAQAVWRRVFALNWLAESQFEAASGVFLKYAADGGAPRGLKVAAMLNLGIHKHKQGLPTLVAALKENDPLSQAVAIAALGEFGEATTAAEVRPFLSSRNDTIAVTSVEAVGKLKDGESVPVLLKLLADKGQEKRHQEIARALSKIDTQPAWDSLLAAVSDRKYGF
ncbi:MAG: HEAT repeat domain-containing protein [Bryobacterales bacterium]|nr:HEAT repeat domain-containing protein [Bryobacterales bacterium]